MITEIRTIELRNLFIAAAVAVGVLIAAPAKAVITGGGCVNDVSGEDNVCTANDVTFVVVGLGLQSDGCVGTSDEVSIFLQGVVRNTTAQTRYDIGLYIATDGDGNGDGALTGTCAREVLTPVGTQGVTTCGASDLDLLRQFPTGTPNNGPYLNVDGDSCGDLFAQGNSGCDQDSDGKWDDSVIQFDQALTFPCDDVDANGFVEIPTCATWGNQNNQVGGTSCDGATEAVPGTKSKCRCETINSTIPVADLGLTCGCTPSTVDPGGPTTCTITYTNNTTCTPDTDLPEREQCGTASFIRYKVDFDETNGSVSGITPSGSGGGGSATSDGSVITWTPSSGAGTAGIIGPGESATLTYTYTLDLDADQNTTISATTTSYWSNVSGFSPEEAQSALTCSLDITSTPVTLAALDSWRRGDTTTIEWTTATETRNVGFNVYEKVGNGWRKLNDELIPSQAVDAAAPLSYRFETSGLRGRNIAIEDVDVTGATSFHGPFEVGKPHGGKPFAKRIDWGNIRSLQGARAQIQARGGKPGGPAATGVELFVDEDGIYRVTYEELAGAGFDLSSIAANKLALVNRGNAVPLFVPGTGKLGPGSYVEFVGEALDTLYTETNVYRLTGDPKLAARILAEDAAAAAGSVVPFYQETVWVEGENSYSFSSPTNDPWYQSRLLTFTSPRSWSFPLMVDHLVPGAGTARLRVELWGSTVWPQALDHHLRIKLNGTQVADELFDGRVARAIEVEVAAGLLLEGTNTLTIELPADRGVPFDLINLDGYGVTYPRAFVARPDGLHFTAAGDRFEVQGIDPSGATVFRIGAGAPVRLATSVAADGSLAFTGSGSSAEYWVVPGGGVGTPGIRLSRPQLDIKSGPAEYLVISHGSFIDGLAPLMAARESQGLSVRVVDVADVYAQFGDGIFGPEPIRDYIRHAAFEMGTEYVLLVGGDTYDYRDYLGLGSVSFIPSPYVATGEVVTFAPSDAVYADLDRDNVPDLAIGRFPVRSPAELDAVVSKTLAYEAKAYGRTAVLAADRVDRRAGMSFAAESQEFFAQLPSGWSADEAYLDTLGVAGARTRLLGALNSGVALTSFIGHSGPTMWTFSGLFTTSDIDSLTNYGAPTVAIQWGCWNNYHVEPQYNTLGHELLLTQDRGAAAVLGSSTLLDTSSARQLSPIFGSLVAKPGVTLGDALTAAKQKLALQHPDLLDVLLGWTLLGDPALKVEP